MPDDPLYGDRPRPPLVPMNNSEIIDFDIARELAGASPRKRVIVIGAVLAGVVLIALLTALYTQSPPVRVQRVRADTPQQALTYLCAQFGAAETAFGSGGATAEVTFKQRMTTIADTNVAFDSASISRFEDDLAAVDAQLSTYDSIAGPRLVDIHKVCG